MISLPHKCSARSELARICRRFGAKLLRISDRDFNVLDWSRHSSCLYPCPFDESMGIHWPNKIIYYHGDVHWGSILHEMAHTIASNENPDNADEWAFLGWEMTIAKKLGWLQWVNNNGGYQLPEQYQFRNIDNTPPEMLQRVFEQRVERAKEVGILTPTGRLKSARL